MLLVDSIVESKPFPLSDSTETAVIGPLRPDGGSTDTTWTPAAGGASKNKDLLPPLTASQQKGNGRSTSDYYDL